MPATAAIGSVDASPMVKPMSTLMAAVQSTVTAAMPKSMPSKPRIEITPTDEIAGARKPSVALPATNSARRIGETFTADSVLLIFSSTMPRAISIPPNTVRKTSRKLPPSSLSGDIFQPTSSTPTATGDGKSAFVLASRRSASASPPPASLPCRTISWPPSAFSTTPNTSSVRSTRASSAARSLTDSTGA